MSAQDLVQQLEEDRRQLAHYQGLVDELRHRIDTAERELSHAQPVLTDETVSDSHMTFREAMEFITAPEHTFRPIVRITDGLVIECCDACDELSDYGLGHVQDRDTAHVVWYDYPDIVGYQYLLDEYEGITDSIFVLLPRERYDEQFEIGEAGPFDYQIIE